MFATNYSPTNHIESTWIGLYNTPTAYVQKGNPTIDECPG